MEIFMYFDSFLTGHKNAETGWCAKALLAGGHNNVNTPSIHLDLLARYRANSIDHNLEWTTALIILL
jgi:hypothetical protein